MMGRFAISDLFGYSRPPQIRRNAHDFSERLGKNQGLTIQANMAHLYWRHVRRQIMLAHEPIHALSRENQNY